MKAIKKKLIYMFYLLVIMISCNDDTVEVDSTPEFNSFVESISSLPGEIVTFEAVISDPAGVKSVNIKYDNWFLDKTIFKDSLPDVYKMSYRFTVPNDEEEFSVHTIPVTITNAGDVSTKKEVVITLDKDIDAPLISINSPENNATVLVGAGDEINFNIDLTDRELAEFKVESDILNEIIPLNGVSTYNYSKSLDVASPGSYTFNFTAKDITGNESTSSVTVSVVTDLQFTAMYLTDETNDAALSQDIFGIPFSTTASQASGENGYVFTAFYYSKNANSEVRFIPQQGSFSPFAFGANTNSSNKLNLGSDATVNPIIIPGVGYYEITMDVRDLSYSVTPYTPTDSAFDQVYVLGRGIFVDGTTSTCTKNSDGATQCWHFNSGKPLVQDSNNQFLWTLDVTIKDQPDDNGANGFILNANPTGWAPFWRTNTEDRSIAVPGGGGNYVFEDSALDKDYTFIFDTHLNRVIIKNR
ncbi:hypothetical protein [uncultured Polaribacter sp.]|uniref:hypothetical protein n=1 Tax=uncultured Polaribacter sp. TaxID=174711 RepID=UPI002638BD1F|nr:hypothetical protein [uncultured Polaribacter sp.]